MPFGQLIVAIQMYNICKGRLGSRGERVPGGGGTMIFSHIRRLGPFFGAQNSEFQYFLGFSEK